MTLRAKSLGKTSRIASAFGEGFLSPLVCNSRFSEFSVLLYGPSKCGKTTLLKELVRTCWGHQEQLKLGWYIPTRINIDGLTVNHADFGCYLYDAKGSFFQLTVWEQATREITCPAGDSKKALNFFEHPWPAMINEKPAVCVFLGSREYKKETYDYFSFLHRMAKNLGINGNFAELAKKFSVLPKRMDDKKPQRGEDPRYMMFVLANPEKPLHSLFSKFRARTQDLAFM